MPQRPNGNLDDVTFLPQWSEFLVKDRCDFDKQYYAFYNARQRQMGPWLEQSAREKWGDECPVIKMNQMVEYRGRRVILTGILLKVMKLQPSVLREVDDSLELVPEEKREKYIHDDDYLRLQDDSEQVILVGGPDVASHVTGVAVAVIGTEHDNGSKFMVEDFTYAVPAPQTVHRMLGDDHYVLFISDLGISLAPNESLVAAREALLDFVSGGFEKKISDKACMLNRIIVAGNCLADVARKQEKELEEMEECDQDEWNRKEKAYTEHSVEMLDEFLSQLAQHVPVDVMPGQNDPTSILMPQQPIHHSLLPKSRIAKNKVTCTPNPYKAKVGDILIVGTAGRVVRSIQELSSLNDATGILEKCLTWRHLAPTAPDSVYAFPFQDNDPFVINERPHVFFTGNQEAFNVKLSVDGAKRTRFLAIPSFKNTQTCVLLNLRNMISEVMAFSF